MYLHEQLRLVGTEPIAIERVSTYRGLSSRSIRVGHTLYFILLWIFTMFLDAASAYGKQREEASFADTGGGAGGKRLARR
jgi:hypothetical protein